jgi:hypothetical protein
MLGHPPNQGHFQLLSGDECAYQFAATGTKKTRAVFSHNGDINTASMAATFWGHHSYVQFCACSNRTRNNGTKGTVQFVGLNVAKGTELDVYPANTSHSVPFALRFQCFQKIVCD